MGALAAVAVLAVVGPCHDSRMDPFAGAEPVLEDLDGAEAALEKLTELPGAEPVAGGFRMSFDGTALLVRIEGEHWTILAAPGVDPGEAMAAARKLHGKLGAAPEGWDLDR